MKNILTFIWGTLPLWLIASVLVIHESQVFDRTCAYVGMQKYNVIVFKGEQLTVSPDGSEFSSATLYKKNGQIVQDHAFGTPMRGVFHVIKPASLEQETLYRKFFSD